MARPQYAFSKQLKAADRDVSATTEVQGQRGQQNHAGHTIID
jgi:hypothetical protein